ncbi:hypothetical protein [Nitratifractor sp.]
MKKFSKSFWTRIKWYGGLFGIFAGRVLYIELVYGDRTSDLEKAHQLMAIQLSAFFAAAILAIAILDLLLQLFFINRTAFIRLTAVLSAIWILLIAIAYDVFRYSSDINEFLLVGLLPILIIWGLIWAFGLYKRKEPQ